MLAWPSEEVSPGGREVFDSDVPGLAAGLPLVEVAALVQRRRKHPLAVRAAHVDAGRDAVGRVPDDRGIGVLEVEVQATAAGDDGGRRGESAELVLQLPQLLLAGLPVAHVDVDDEQPGGRARDAADVGLVRQVALPELGPYLVGFQEEVALLLPSVVDRVLAPALGRALSATSAVAGDDLARRVEDGAVQRDRCEPVLVEL